MDHITSGALVLESNLGLYTGLRLDFAKKMDNTNELLFGSFII